MATWSILRTAPLRKPASTSTHFSMALSQSFHCRQKGTDYDKRIGASNRSAACPLVIHGRLHRVLRGLDHLRDHRHPDPKESWSFRHATGPAGRHANPDRITDPAYSWHLVRPIWWAPGVLRHHAVRGRDDRAAGAGL